MYFVQKCVYPDISQIKSGAIAELLAGIEIVTYQSFKEKAELYYWHKESKSSNAEVDYVTAIGNRIVPVEVKSGSSGSMKSLRTFIDAKCSDYAVKISGFNFSLFENVRTVPFYGIESLVKEEV